jgi:hypothetical protein
MEIKIQMVFTGENYVEDVGMYHITWYKKLRRERLVNKLANLLDSQVYAE